ncbi:PEP/pyruvate-binding domain-containing protein [Dactylosporangium sp. NPDC050688]|uniref:PEP/pyruvate-binding domain-containing protein n=1 Tax=Dactylosporangium sp. NPDC050688 TaxID=3157217 RepID=UPI0033C03EB8
MPDRVVALADLRAGDAGVAGAKAANLGELIHAGLPIPAGFCLPVAVYREVVTPALAGLLDGDVEGDADRLRRAVERIDLPATIQAELVAAYRRISPDGGPVAVRSSGTSEDSAGASFAGQYHTELAVTAERLLDAVRRCWASLWQPQAVRYRQRQGIAHTDAAMAVVVQVMVEADAAGVLFTADPGAAGSGELVIESSWGYGEAVVGGLVNPDRFHVARAGGRIVRAELSRKTVAVGPGGPVDVADERQAHPSLTAVQVAELARLALEIERHFGAPQDVEWAYAAGRPAVLQARPVTRSVAVPDVAWHSPVEGAWWARISICDAWLPEPLSTLFATTLYPSMVQRWTWNWAGGERAALRNPLLPRPMAGVINGFAYLRLDFPLNRHPLWTARLVAGWFRFHLARLERRWRGTILPRHVERIAEAAAADLAAMDGEAVLRLLGDVERLSAEYWAIIGGLAWYWNVGEWLLAAAFRRLSGSGDSHTPLLLGYPTTTSRAEQELYHLARDGGGPDTAAFAAFLARYGHQVHNLDFAEPTPAEDPVAFTAALDAYRQGHATDPHERLRDLAGRRERAEAAVFHALRRSPLRRRVLRGLLRWSRRYAQVRDETLFAFTLGWPVLRRGYLELGRRLATTGVLGAPADVFHLSGDELRAAVHGDPTDRRDDVRRRRGERERQRRLNPPRQVPPDARIHLGPFDITALAVFGADTDDGEPGGLRGAAVSPGRVTGTARVVRSTDDFGRLRPGDVLVAPHITPAWSSLLAIAGAVVTDVGGVLSHGSIVAREYGIPAVMGTTDATRHIVDGQVVTVDGDRGRVH